MSRAKRNRIIDTKKKWLISLLVPLAVLGQGLSNKANAEDIYAPVPTLTKLHEEGVTIPDTNPPIVYPESAYNFVNNTSYDINIKPQGTGDTNVYYKWTTDGSGNRQLTTGTANNYDITAKYNSSVSTVQTGNYNFGTVNTTSTTEYDPIKIGGVVKNNAGKTIVISDTLYKNNYSSGTINQSTKGFKEARVYGGALSNGGTITSLNADFLGNNFSTTSNFSASSGGLYSYSGGGALSNYSTSSTRGEVGDIIGDFINNSVNATGNNEHNNTYAYGGAIINNGYYNPEIQSTIDSISGDFVGNYAKSVVAPYSVANAKGGAIHNTYCAEIGLINGNFIANFVNASTSSSASSTNAYGGAIYNDQLAKIYEISGDFINNYAIASGSSSHANGGAIYTANSVINTITGDFINNYAKAQETAGGAIYNASNSDTTHKAIYSIVGNFINNYSLSFSGTAFGGAIYNGSIIDYITGDFINNYARSDYSAYGGAIYGKTNYIVNSNFYNNYAKTNSPEMIAQGGAISTGSNLNIIADKGHSTFKGNYVQAGNNEKDYQAIYVRNANSTLTLNSINNGQMYMYDNINGADGYNVHLTGDNTGVLHLYNDIKNGDIISDNITIDTADNNIHNYNFKTLNSDESTLYNIDVDLADNGRADTITTAETSEGVVTLNGFNILNPESSTEQNYKIQVINTQDDNLQLKLGENISDSGEEIAIQTIDSQDVSNDISNNASWNETFGSFTETTNVMGKVTLETTNTTNDSIGLTVTGTKIEKTNVVEYGDTLALVNQLETTEGRSFGFDTANDKYNASSDLGKTTAGQLSINGVSVTNEGTTTRSEINLNGHKGFELDNETTLNVNDTRLTGNDTLITVNNQNAIVNLQNADLNGSIAAENSYKLNITGDTSDRTIINGGVGKANATHSGGELGFNTDTFKDAEFSTMNGTVDLVTGQVENYDIGKLTSDESANWIFEVDSSGSGADTLTVGTGSSGTVNVSEINFVNGDSPSDEFTVQVLNAQDDNIQLSVDPSIAGENHKLGTVTKTSQDTVTPTAKWNQTFNKYTQNGTNYGNIDVATTNTTNDSLQLKVTSTEWDEKTISGSMGDTLALVNQLETEENRNFNFDTANDVYKVKSDLGTTAEGTMNVNGVKSGETRSTINGNNYNMFVLSNPTTLNLNNVKIQGANSVVSGTNKNAVINMNNAELKNNASGITTAGSVNISGKSVFDNNGNGIEVTDENSIITLNGLDGEGYDVTFKDKLKGVSGAKLNLKAGQVEFHKSVTDLDINMDGTTANLKSDNVFNGQNLTVASASNVSMINNSVGTMQLNSLTLNDNMNLGVDVDLANKSMDRISANTYNLGDHKVNVNKMNLLSDAKEVRTDIEFADEQLRNNVTTSVSEVAYSPIYKYGVKYDQDNGEFQFTRSNSGGGGDSQGGGSQGGGNNSQPQPSYNDLNPAIMASPVAAQLGGYAGMLDNYGNAFNHMDMYMLKPKNLRAAELNANKYAITDGRGGTYISNETNTNGIWVRPYTSYDSVGLKHGPKVHNLSYGSFIGGDFGMHDFGNGMYGTFSPYISYQGAHQHYSGNSVYQNGGTLGFTGTLYKGNFFTGLTAGVGANVTEASTMYGNEDFPMLTTGVASKTGYNIEFKDGKFIIQPSLLVSYTFVNTFDYKNGAGVKIDTAPLHAVQISPNIRFSFNTKNHWQPYAFVGMNWNIMDSGHFKAADTTLPELSMKPYVHYGLGIQKLFSDNFTAFAQVAIRNGGRNGVGGTLGLKWLFGGQPQKQEEQKPKNVL